MDFCLGAVHALCVLRRITVAWTMQNMPRGDVIFANLFQASAWEQHPVMPSSMLHHCLMWLFHPGLMCGAFHV